MTTYNVSNYEVTLQSAYTETTTILATYSDNSIKTTVTASPEVVETTVTTNPHETLAEFQTAQHALSFSNLKRNESVRYLYFLDNKLKTVKIINDEV